MAKQHKKLPQSRKVRSMAYMSSIDRELSKGTLQYIRVEPNVNTIRMETAFKSNSCRQNHQLIATLTITSKLVVVVVATGHMCNVAAGAELVYFT